MCVGVSVTITSSQCFILLFTSFPTLMQWPSGSNVNMEATVTTTTSDITLELAGAPFIVLLALSCLLSLGVVFLLFMMGW